AIAASSPARASSASATASSASARRGNAEPEPHAGAAPPPAVTAASTSASVVSATGSPTGSPVRGSNPWIISAPSYRHGRPADGDILYHQFGDVNRRVGRGRRGDGEIVQRRGAHRVAR